MLKSQHIVTGRPAQMEVDMWSEIGPKQTNSHRKWIIGKDNFHTLMSARQVLCKTQ